MFQFQGYRILSAPLLAALLMMAVGALAMMNVQQDLWVLHYRLSDIVPIQANTAVVFVLAGLTLLLRSFYLSSSRANTIIAVLASVLALCVAVLGLSTLGQYLSGMHLDIERVLSLIHI